MPRASRNEGLDVLKGALTLLVVLHHTAITYGAQGGWFLREIPFDGSPSALLLTLFCAVNQAYFMGLFFLLAGYFTPESMRRKGARRFVADRLLRLAIPLAVFGWLLGPLTVALARGASGAGFSATFGALLRAFTFRPGPLWFALALLLFSFLAVAAFEVPAARRWLANRDDTPFPGNAVLAVAAFACGVVSFGVRLVWPVGSEVMFMQLGYFPGYVLMFATGCVAARHGWLERVPAQAVRLWRRIAWLALPLIALVPVLAALGPSFRGDTAGGVNLPALIYALWEPFVAWGAILWLLASFARRPVAKHGFARDLARRAYAIYVIHPPVLVGIAIALAPLAITPLVKFALCGSLACAACYALSGALLRLPGVDRVL